MAQNTIFSLLRASFDVAEDSSLGEPIAHGALTVTQTKDVKCFTTKYTVQVGASETEVVFSSEITQGYRWALLSDYPVQYRTNSNSLNQQKTLTSGNVAATNIGAPQPYQCCVIATEQITRLWLAPISGATTAANVKVIVVGDPVNAYT